MWELDHKESWVLKNRCFWTVVLGKTLEGPLDCKEIQPVHPKGNPEYSLEGLMLKLKLQYFGHLIRRADIWKAPDAGKDWRWEEKGMTEDEMVGWHHQPNGHGFRWTPGVGDGQGGLACCNSLGRKESDTTERLNWTELNWLNDVHGCVEKDNYIHIVIYIYIGMYIKHTHIYENKEISKKC